MENASLVAMSRQMVLRRQMDIAANNLANMNTTAFKGQTLVFDDMPLQANIPGPDRGRPLSLVTDLVTAQNWQVGDFEATGGTLDIALDGPGYLVVETGAGPRYTRNGGLRIDSDRQLVDVNGFPILATNDQPIRIPDEYRSLEIRGDGQIIIDGEDEVARLRLAAFDNLHALDPLGGGLYVANEVPREADGTAVIQGMIETSNVEPILEMTRMIEVMRAYSSASQMIDQEHERQRTAIQRLGQAQA